MKYGIISERYLGPIDQPAHQYLKNDTPIQCINITISKKRSNSLNSLFFTFRKIPYIENNNIGEKINKPLDGLIACPTNASKKTSFEN